MRSSQTKICFPHPGKGHGRRVVIKVNPREIAYIVMVFEAYDFIGTPRTIDRRNGIVEILTTPDFVNDVDSVIHALKDEIDSLEILVA